jgi:hypothetical protein
MWVKVGPPPLSHSSDNGEGRRLAEFDWGGAVEKLNCKDILKFYSVISNNVMLHRMQ